MNTHWTELNVADDLNTAKLGYLIDTRYEYLAEIGTGIAGGITTWDGHFVYADGEEPGWDTPRGPVDWTGFAQALDGAL